MRSHSTTLACAHCGQSFRPDQPTRQYCSRKCYHAASKGKPKPPEHGARVSAATTGKPKPWSAGERNPNWRGKAQAKAGVRERMLEAIRQRGQAWTEEDRQAHAECMKGPSNKMRGRHHSEETKTILAKAKREAYANGEIAVPVKVSRVEIEIGESLAFMGLRVQEQYWVPGLSYRFDFYLPDLNVLLEYQGNYWHANPALYPAERVMTLGRGRELTAAEIWARDAARRAAAESKGYKVAWVWERDYSERGIGAVLDAIREVGRVP